jgi:hypothetical protein
MCCENIACAVGLIEFGVKESDVSYA